MSSRIGVVAVPVSCGLLLVLVGCGGTSQAVRRGRIDVRIRLTTYRLAVRKVQSFTLFCEPTGGNLPLAARVCRDIRVHPQAMLDPPRPGPPRKSSLCAGGPFMPQLAVTVTANGKTRRFGGSPGCNWPGGQAVAVYFDAATNESQDMSGSESELRCDEDPMLLAVPTPLASVVACRHGLWTPRSERLIRIAEKTPALAALQASRLFPREIGAQSCTIHAGGPFPGKKLSGLCGVTMKNVWENATVSFTEDWQNGLGTTSRHIWRVVIKGAHVIAISQTGPVPPQLRR
jgi:hypothetical protein